MNAVYARHTRVRLPDLPALPWPGGLAAAAACLRKPAFASLLPPPAAAAPPRRSAHARLTRCPLANASHSAHELAHSAQVSAKMAL